YGWRGAGVASRREAEVAADGRPRQRRVGTEERCDQRGERRVLRIGVGRVVGALELDAEREVVAAAAPLVLGLAGVPGAQLKRHVLHDLAVAADEGMGRSAQTPDLPEIRVRGGGQRAG